MNDIIKRLEIADQRLAYGKSIGDIDLLTDAKQYIKALVDGSNRLINKWREGDFDLPPYVKGKMDGCHQCADELRALLGDDDG